MEGTYLGLSELKTQLTLCPMTFTDVQNMQQFGVITNNTCNFDLSKLLSTDMLQSGDSVSENVFF